VNQRPCSLIIISPTESLDNHRVIKFDVRNDNLISINKQLIIIS
jgi:hypothetical protein